jgi:hypothetical protein
MRRAPTGSRRTQARRLHGDRRRCSAATTSRADAAIRPASAPAAEVAAGVLAADRRGDHVGLACLMIGTDGERNQGRDRLIDSIYRSPSRRLAGDSRFVVNDNRIAFYARSMQSQPVPAACALRRALRMPSYHARPRAGDGPGHHTAIEPAPAKFVLRENGGAGVLAGRIPGPNLA